MRKDETFFSFIGKIPIAYLRKFLTFVLEKNDCI